MEDPKVGFPAVFPFSPRLISVPAMQGGGEMYPIFGDLAPCPSAVAVGGP